MISEVKRKKEYKEMEKFFVGKIFFEMFLNERQVVYFKLVYILYKFGRDIQCVCWLTDNASKKKNFTVLLFYICVCLLLSCIVVSIFGHFSAKTNFTHTIFDLISLYYYYCCPRDVISCLTCSFCKLDL